MKIPYIEFLFRPIRSELPHCDSLDDYIDVILPKIAPYSEDLYEEEYYTDKPWREVSDSDSLDVILHILKTKESPHEIAEKSDAEGPDYLMSIDGNIVQGNWGRLGKKDSDIITLRNSISYELYEKEFINEDFFILKKHGDKWKEKNMRKYLVLGREGHVKDAEWREVVELLYDIYRYRDRFIIMILVAAIIIFTILILST